MSEKHPHYANQPVHAVPAAPAPAYGLAVASLVTGIAGIVVPLSAVAAIVLALVARKRGQATGLWLSGLIVGIVATVVWTVYFAIWIVVIVTGVYQAGMATNSP
jgi:hypothetical protein